MNMLQDFLHVFIPLLIIVNPASTVTLFTILSKNSSKKDRKIVSRNTVIYATVLLIIFSFTGFTILKLLNISIYSFLIAGGVLLIVVGLDMVRSGIQFGEQYIKGQKPLLNYSLVPLALPSLSGPGAITFSLVKIQTAEWWLILLSILLTMVIVFIILLKANNIIRFLGEKGMDALTRVMGLLIVAISVQFIIDGISLWISTY